MHLCIYAFKRFHVELIVYMHCGLKTEDGDCAICKSVPPIYAYRMRQLALYFVLFCYIKNLM